MHTNIHNLSSVMNSYKEELIAREQYLSSIIDSESNYLDSSSIRGSILARKQHNRWSLLHETKMNGEYTRQAVSPNDKLTKSLISKEYAIKELRVVRANLKAVSLFLNNFINKSSYDVADEFNEFKATICPDLCCTRKSLEDKFLSMQITASFFSDNLIFKTLRGESVRSKSESMIADALYNHGFAYVYEYPLQLKNGRMKSVDFAILNKATMELLYWEHFGMLGDEKYTSDAIRKMQLYADNGIFPGDKLIVTYESVSAPLTSSYIEEIIHHYLK